VFPRGGKLRDLDSYTQWSWPEDGNVAAYFGYDVNVEFNESYINALYVGVPGAIRLTTRCTFVVETAMVRTWPLFPMPFMSRPFVRRARLPHCMASRNCPQRFSPRISFHLSQSHSGSLRAR
jgi:hypothetical protein